MAGRRPELVEPLVALHATLGAGIPLIDKGPAGFLLSVHGHRLKCQYYC